MVMTVNPPVSDLIITINMFHQITNAKNAILAHDILWGHNKVARWVTTVRGRVVLSLTLPWGGNTLW